MPVESSCLTFDISRFLASCEAVQKNNWVRASAGFVPGRYRNDQEPRHILCKKVCLQQEQKRPVLRFTVSLADNQIRWTMLADAYAAMVRAGRKQFPRECSVAAAPTKCFGALQRSETTLWQLRLTHGEINHVLGRQEPVVLFTGLKGLYPRLYTLHQVATQE